MLLIAVTGPVGVGKTTLLERFVAHATASGYAVDGFVAVADGRPEPGRGADGYGLRFVTTGDVTPYAAREEATAQAAGHVRGGVPYRFDPDADARLDAWAGSLGRTARPDVVVLDEFGRREADGGGLVRLWPAVVAAGVPVAVLAVRAGAVGAVEARLGLRFDAVVDAAGTDAEGRLHGLLAAHADWARVGAFGAGAGGVEVGLGSALHAGQVPMRGLVLSSLQAGVLAVAGGGLVRRTRLAWVPVVAAGLKALSPAGNRLRPMLAITMQGLLFTAATALVGWNRAGVFLGGALVGAWAAAQGLVLQALLVGGALTEAFTAAVGWVADGLGVAAPGLAVVFGAWTLAWGAVAGTAALVAHRRLSEDGRAAAWLARQAGQLPAPAPAASWAAALRLGARDLARPAFWVPLGLVAAFVVAAGSPWMRALGIVLRAVAVGLVLFALARRLRPDRLAAWLRRRGHWGPSVAFERALRKSDEPRVTSDE